LEPVTGHLGQFDERSGEENAIVFFLLTQGQMLNYHPTRPQQPDRAWMLAIPLLLTTQFRNGLINDFEVNGPLPGDHAEFPSQQ
jgi:hypothetical protein